VGDRLGPIDGLLRRDASALHQSAFEKGDFLRRIGQALTSSMLSSL
jgi:hypothetical protein